MITLNLSADHLVPMQSHRFDSELAALLELRHQSQHLLRGLDEFILHVGSAVSAGLLQKVAIINHYATGVGDAPRARVRLPVQPPHGGTVLKVEVGHRV